MNIDTTMSDEVCGHPQIVNYEPGKPEWRVRAYFLHQRLGYKRDFVDWMEEQITKHKFKEHFDYISIFIESFTFNELINEAHGMTSTSDGKGGMLPFKIDWDDAICCKAFGRFEYLISLKMAQKIVKDEINIKTKLYKELLESERCLNWKHKQRKNLKLSGGCP